MTARHYTYITIMFLCFSILIGSSPIAVGQGRDVSFENLSAGEILNGFRTAALYLNDTDQPMGGHFVHARTGFTFDVLQIQSVPQGFIWVNTFPTSDMGEPHTQEHLLLGKGNKGRAVANLVDMSLADSTAITLQWRTAYHFHTVAGPEVFYQLLERQIDALLHPDYTDEEIRREVRHFGVTENPADETLWLEEKGTVYNEMVNSFDRPGPRLFHAILLALYGEGHPLAYSSGGTPEAIRKMKPEHIRTFHRENYHLGNMGMIGSFPKEMRLGDLLRRMAEILNRLQPSSQTQPVKTEVDLLAPKMASVGDIQIVDWPHRNDQRPGSIFFAWPLDTQETLLLELFVDNLAGDATTNFYKRFVDTKTREMDLGARGVFGRVSDDLGHPVFIGLRGVAPVHMTEEKVAEVQQKVMEEIARIAAWEDGSQELTEFNSRLKNRVIQERREMSKFVNSPPRFGFRSTGPTWMSHLHRLNQSKDFQKSVTLKPELAFVEKLLASDENFWRGYIEKWKLAETPPYAVVARPNPELLEKERSDRQARIEAEIARLKTHYGVSDDQEAIRRFRADYDVATAELDKLAKQDATSRFLDAPPLTLDDPLDYNVSTLTGDVQMVASTFDNMTSATVGLAVRLDGVPEGELMYLSILPDLLTRVGVIADGEPISYDEMSERLRREVLSLDAHFSTNFRTNRAELVLRGAGNDIAETQRAVEWMKMVTLAPDWRPENLARIRDVVDQSLSRLRNRMQRAEESWVNDPANAYWRQDNPLLLTTSSFLTRAHNVHRLRWMLKDGDTPEDREAISTFLNNLATAGAAADRAGLKTLLNVIQGNTSEAEEMPARLKPYADDFERLPDGAKALAIEWAKDLDQILTDIPDASLAADWGYLCNQIRHDLLISSEKTLADLNTLRQRLLKTGNLRMFMVGSQSSQQQLESNIGDLLAGMEVAPATVGANHRLAPTETRLIDARLRDRLPETGAIVFVGLINPNMQGGVFLNSAPSVTYHDTEREALLQFLASKLYGGGGAHSIFMKTWGAGLAYSNGVGGSPNTGRQTYYAERTPELPQTLRFVIDELKKAPHDENLVEYAVAQTFSGARSASGYEARGEAIADDFADGVTPEVVSRFRQAILELRQIPKLSDALYNRMGDVYAKVLPGYGVKAKEVAGAVYFVIGPESQFDRYEAYLKSVEGPEASLHRLYPRDFWMAAQRVNDP